MSNSEYYQNKFPIPVDIGTAEWIDRKGEGEPPSSSPKTAKRKTHDFFEPVREVWELKAGVDLMQIEGISATAASVILSEVGMDIGRFKSAKHLASWAGLINDKYSSPPYGDAYRRYGRSGIPFYFGWGALKGWLSRP